MKTLSLSLICLMFLAVPVVGDELQPQQAALQGQSTLEKLKANPNDLEAVNVFMTERLSELAGLLNTDPQVATERLAQMSRELGALQPDDAKAKQLVGKAKTYVDNLLTQVKITQVTLPEARQSLEENPDNPLSLKTYFLKLVEQIRKTAETQPEVVLEELADAQKLLTSIAAQTEDDATKQLVGEYQGNLTKAERQIKTMRLTLPEVRLVLEKNPESSENIDLYFTKLVREVSTKMVFEPEEAATQLAAGRELLESIAEKTEDQTSRQLIESRLDKLARIEQRLEGDLKRTTLIGTHAAPLAVEKWINGAPLTESDLEGKVVLLDFWAVWCGPCMSSLPQLRDWYDKYNNEGLEIVGLTRYYNFGWDEQTGKPHRAESEVSSKDEQKMLEKFAQSQNIPYRFAIEKGSSLVDHYGVTGIPQMVVIDQQGKVRLIRVGVGKENVQAISDLLAELMPQGEGAKHQEQAKTSAL